MSAPPKPLPEQRAAFVDDILISQIADGSRVIDLGCGDGRLISRLRDEHQCSVLGIERDRAAFLATVRRGVSAIMADLNRGLDDIPAGTFDYAVLSETLQQVNRPMQVLHEMLRVARRALIVVPNFGHWRVRAQIMLQGRAPVTDSLPYEWYESPNVHFLSMLDFRDLARRGNFRIVKELPIVGQTAMERAWFSNWRAQSALYVLENAHPASDYDQRD
ncbi:MAG: methionine biosynthesis protein MetW [Planctomycetota bacterium]|nr:MAG: methionine biosynthesis protein MetW [Planctomycetota bacterium]